VGDADGIVYRRVSSLQIETDYATGELRPTSANFTDSTRPNPSPMSCVADWLLDDRPPESLVPGPGGDLLVALTVADLNEIGLEVVPDPIPDEPAHVLVEGAKTRSVRRALAVRSRWIVAPSPQPSPPAAEEAPS
jgi:hypothetical protein